MGRIYLRKLALLGAMFATLAFDAAHANLDCKHLDRCGHAGQVACYCEPTDCCGFLCVGQCKLIPVCFSGPIKDGGCVGREDVAEIKVEPLPPRIEMTGYPVVLTGIKGFQAEVELEKAVITVPNSPTFLSKNGKLCIAEEECRRGQCSDTGCAAGGCPRNPMLTLAQWHERQYTRLKINANWFDISGPPGYPYVKACTSIRGVTVSNRTEISPILSQDNGNYMDVLAFRRTGGKTVARLVLADDFTKARAGLDIEQAVSGVILAQRGKLRNLPEIQSSAKPSARGARTGVGLSADGRKMWIVVSQPGPGDTNTMQFTARELALYMVRLGASDVINLDNSGSSQFIFDPGDQPGDYFYTLPGDRHPKNNLPAHRPIPNFLGID